jgi:hypothetical protein
MFIDLSGPINIKYFQKQGAITDMPGFGLKNTFNNIGYFGFY